MAEKNTTSIINTFNLNNDDVLLHFNILGISPSSFKGLLKTGKLKEIISQNDSWIDYFVCLRKSGRGVDQKSLLLCAAMYYAVHKGKRHVFEDKINEICKIPTDLFQLMNLVFNEGHINRNFIDLVDLTQFKEMIGRNKFNKKKEKKKSKKKNGTPVETDDEVPPEKKSNTDISEEMRDVSLEDFSLKESRKKKMGSRSSVDAVPAKRAKKNTVDGITEGIEEFKLNNNVDSSFTQSERSKIRSFINQHKFIKQWYCDPTKTALDLLYMLTKYKNRCGWDHKMILQNSHFKFKGMGLPKGDDKENDESMEVTNGASKCHSQWEGGDSNLVINYVLHGTTNLKKVDKYKKYFEQRDETVYKETGVTEIHSQILSGIYILEHSKLKAGEKWEDEEKVNKVSDMIEKLKRTPQPERSFSTTSRLSVEFAPVFSMSTDSDDDEDDCRMALPGGDVLFSNSSSSSLPAADNVDVVSEKGTRLLRFHVCAEHVPAPLHKSPRIREALMKDMPMVAFIRHVCCIASHGLFSEQENVQELINKLQCPTRLRRVHPFQILKAVMEYKQGGVKRKAGGQGKEGKKWDVDDTIYKALCGAFYLSLKYFRRGTKDTDTFPDLNYKICIESSGPMLKSGFIGNPKLSGTRAAVAMSLAIRNFCNKTDINICGEEKVYRPGEEVWSPIKCDNVISEDISMTDDSSDLIAILDGIQLVTPKYMKGGIIQQMPESMYKSKSNLAQPVTEAIENNEKVDAFILFTLSDPNLLVGKSPYDEFCRYRESVNPASKLILCTMEARTQIIADPSDANVKVLCGVDAYLLHEIVRCTSPEQSATENHCKFCYCKQKSELRSTEMS